MSDRPVIGVTCDVREEKRTLVFVFRNYLDAVERAGGLPLPIPPLSDPALVPQVLSIVHGIVIVGGEDLDPALYGEEPLATHDPVPADRQRFDLALADALLAGETPTLGVCYGCQLLAVASGGALHQHIPTQVGDDVAHAGKYPDLPFHPVEITEGSRLARTLGATRCEVNSAHHQAPKRLGAGLTATAIAPDGVLEAFEADGDRFLLGVEWHPELITDRPEQQALFDELVREARRAR